MKTPIEIITKAILKNALSVLLVNNSRKKIAGVKIKSNGKRDIFAAWLEIINGPKKGIHARFGCANFAFLPIAEYAKEIYK
jgi:hypothetical protein